MGLLDNLRDRLTGNFSDDYEDDDYYDDYDDDGYEGDDYDQLMDIVKECQHVAIRCGAPKVSAYIKVVYEPKGEILTIDEKVTKHHQD